MLIRNKLFVCFLFLSISSIGQNNYVKTDLNGYFYPLYVDKEVRSLYGIKLSLGYERDLHAHFSVGGYLNYGFSPYTVVSVIEFFNDRSIDGATFTKGITCFLEGRYYPFPVYGKRYGNITGNKGLFIGIYAGIMSGKEMDYDHKPNGFIQVDDNIILSYGIGPIIGYKIIIVKHFFVEPLIGVAYGWEYINGIQLHHAPDDKDYALRHLGRLELSVGYAF